LSFLFGDLLIIEKHFGQIEEKIPCWNAHKREFTSEPWKSISYDSPPPQGLSEARRPPRGRPFMGGGVHRRWGHCTISPHRVNHPATIISNNVQKGKMITYIHEW